MYILKHELSRNFSENQKTTQFLTTKGPKVAQMTQRCDFDKAICLEESLVDI